MQTGSRPNRLPVLLSPEQTPRKKTSQRPPKSRHEVFARSPLGRLRARFSDQPCSRSSRLQSVTSTTSPCAPSLFPSPSTWIGAEDTRHSGNLLRHFEIRKPLLSYHEHNEAMRTAELRERLAAGETVALITDAGMPGLSDPGGRLIRKCIELDLPFTIVPGVSAITTALVGSGFGMDNFCYRGFLPVKKRTARTRIKNRRGTAGNDHLFRVALSANEKSNGLRKSDARATSLRRPRADEKIRGIPARDRRSRLNGGATALDFLRAIRLFLTRLPGGAQEKSLGFWLRSRPSLFYCICVFFTDCKNK